MNIPVIAAWAILAVTTGKPGAGPAPASDPIVELLDLPAPAPPWRVDAKPPRKETALAEDAPLELLLRHWAKQATTHARTEFGPKPSDKTRARLLDGCEKEPKFLPDLLPLLTDEPDTHERVKSLYDREQQTEKFGKAWSKTVHDWLMMHSKYFRSELIQGAKDAKYMTWGLDNEMEVNALVKLDWAAAESILKQHVAGGEPRCSAVALSILFQQALAAKNLGRSSLFRKQLQAIVADKKMPGHARDTACNALLKVEWAGKDEWYLWLFSDKTLQELHEGNYWMTPLLEPVRTNPDKWIPVMAKMVGNKDRAIHDAAVSCLVHFQLNEARQDALRPLLPWLADPGWSSAYDRLRLIQSLDRVDLPESVPGLIKVVERANDWELAGAADALAVYRDQRAIPALKKSLERDNSEHHRRSIVAALLACDGLTDEEIAAAIETYALHTSTSNGLDEVDRIVRSTFGGSLSAQLSLGYHLSYQEPNRDQAAARLLKRADALEKEKPAVAGRIRESVQNWPCKAADWYVLRRISESKADVHTLTAALARRKSIQINAGEGLRKLLNKPGPAKGWAAILLGDPLRQAEVLQGRDREAQRALLAGGRLIREPLAVNMVGRLLRKGPKDLALAAERFLESEDSPKARQFVYDQHPGEALILGARMDFDPGHHSYDEFDAWEKRLRDEVRGKDGPEEVHALLSAGYWGNVGQVVIRIRQQKAECSVYGRNKRLAVRSLTLTELKGLRAFIARHGIDDLPPLNIEVYDGIQYEYLHLTKNRGRRVFMNNPDTRDDTPVYVRLTEFFADLARPETEQEKNQSARRPRRYHLLALRP